MVIISWSKVKAGLKRRKLRTGSMQCGARIWKKSIFLSLVPKSRSENNIKHDRRREMKEMATKRCILITREELTMNPSPKAACCDRAVKQGVSCVGKAVRCVQSGCN